MIKLYGHVTPVTYTPIFCFDLWFIKRGIIHLEHVNDSKIGGEVTGAKGYILVHLKKCIKVYFEEDPGLWSNWRYIIGAN